MEKLKRNTRNKSNTAITKTTTPTKAVGKVYKARINIKNMKKPIKPKENTKTNSSDNENKNVPTTRSGLVKLQRTLAKGIRCSSNNGENENSMEKEKNVVKEVVKTTKSKINPEKLTKTAPSKILSNNKECLTDVRDLNENSTKEMKRMNTRNNGVIPKNISNKKHLSNKTCKNTGIEKITPTKTRRCVVKLQKLHHKLKEKEKRRETSLKTLENVVAVPSYTSIASRAKRCFVKLQKTPNKIKENDTSNETSFIAEPSSSTVTRRCKVKLYKTPVAAKTQDVAEPLTSSSTRECRIKLQRKPLSRQNNDYYEYTETVPPAFQQKPVINQNIRHSFRKLSLTKTFRKPAENEELQTNKNANAKEPAIIAEVKNNNDINSTQIPEKLSSNLETQSKMQNAITRSSKLSLTKPNKQNNNTGTNLNVTQFERQENTSICFEPVRNSTLLEIGCNKDTPIENANENCTTTTHSKNLSNKSKEISDLLNSLDDEDEIAIKSPEKRNENEEDFNKANTLIANNKTHKFFNRSREEQRNNFLKEAINPLKKSPPKTQTVKRKGRFKTKRSIPGVKNNIYEFLSQSQTSDSDNTTKRSDPTADIVKKLIDQGKVRVATNCKGKGRPVFKRKHVTKQMKKVDVIPEKILKCTIKNQQKTTKAKQNKDSYDDDEVDHFDKEQLFPDVNYDRNSQIRNDITKQPGISNSKNDQEGTFSRLARTVLINQAGRSNVQRKNDSLLLLEKVKQFVSTPNNKKIFSHHTALQSDLSPIALPPPKMATIPSPWRVNEDAYLPRTFNFSRSSGNLPSFSSDFIPVTPRKEKPKYNPSSLQHETTTACIPNFTIGNQPLIPKVQNFQSPLLSDEENVQPQIPATNESSVISSFSSNDSNVENIPPPRPREENCNDNGNIFNLKQLPNPRRALNYRSPLKSINILEVLHLPPVLNFNKTPKPKENTTPSMEMFGFEENLVEDFSQAEQSVDSINTSPQRESKINKNHPKEDLFGFEEFLSQTDLSSQKHVETNYVNDANSFTQNQTLHNKLQDLRKLKPEENDLQVNLLSEKSQNPLKTIPFFEDATVKLDGMRQRGIKEMLCSTLINPQPSTSKKALQELKKRNLKDSNRPNFGEELNLTELFKDPEPETTFNESDAHRTYIRPYKRKRRLKQNNYVMFLDSDESGDEDNSTEQQKHHHSHEKDTSSEQKAPKQKRQRKVPKENTELNNFVQQFNEMCEEVDSYELIVEKSA